MRTDQSSGTPLSLGGRSLAAVVLLLAIVATIGRPLVGIGSLHAADTLQTLDPWAQTAPQGFRPDNGTVSDTVDAIAPVRISIAERARDGDLALWSSSQGGGAPALGVPNAAMFSPLNLPWWIAPGHAAPALAKALQMLVAAAGLFLFARRLGTSREAALVGALAFVNAGHLVVWTTWPQSNIAALVPWLLWATDRAVSDGGVRSDGPGWPAAWASAWPIALVGAVMWFEGFPSLTLWAHVLAGTWAIVRHDGGRVVARTVTTVGAMAVGLSIAAVQLVPFLHRVDELGLGPARDVKASTVLPWEALGTVVFPRLLGASGQGVWYGPRNEVELQAFLGMTALVLVAIAWTWGRRSSSTVPAVWWRWSSWVLAIVAAMIWIPPLNAGLQALPVVGGNQTGRLRGLIAFVLAVLVAIGFDALRRAVASPERPRLRAPIAIVAVALAATIPVLVRSHDLADNVGRGDFWGQAVARPLGVLAVALVVVAVALQVPVRWRMVAVGIVPILLAVESVSFARGFLPRIDTDRFYPRTEAHDVVADLIGTDRFAAGGLALYPGTTTLHGLRSLTAHAGMPEGWRDLLTEADDGVLAGNPTFPMLAGTAAVASSPALDVLGVSHFVTEEDAPLLGSPGPVQRTTSLLPPGAPINGIEVSRTVLEDLEDHSQPVTLGATITVGSTVVAAGERRLAPDAPLDWLSVPLESTAEDGRRPTAGRLDVFLRVGVEEPGLPVPVDHLVRAVRVGADGLTVVATPDVVVYERPNALPRLRLSSADDGTVTVIADRDDEVVVNVTASSPTTFVVADAWSGGHRASVDGEHVPASLHDGALIGVEVPAGTHEVRVWFEPEGIRPGAALTVLGLLAVWFGARSTLRRR